MAYTRILKSGNVQACWRDAGGRIRTKTFGPREKTKAKRFGQEMESALRNGCYIDPLLGRMSVDAYWDIFIESSRSRLSPTTEYEYIATHRRYISPPLGGRPLASVRRADVEDLMRGLRARGKGPATQSTVLRLLHRVFESAVEREMLQRNPCKGVPLPKQPLRDLQPMTVEETLDLAESFDDRWRVAVLLGAFGGLRIGEVFALTIEKVDWIEGRVRIEVACKEVGGRLVTGPPKGGRHRAVMLPMFVIDALSMQLRNYPPSGEGRIFHNENGGFLHPSNFRKKIWRPTVARIGKPGMRFHDLRHTAVSMAINSGAPLKTVQALAGHASAAMTADRYAHELPSVTKEVARKLDATIRDALVQRAADSLLAPGSGGGQGRSPSA